MNHKQFTEELKSGLIRPVYLIHGEEAFLRQRLFNRLLDTLLPGEWRDMNLLTLQEDAPALRLIEGCEALPMFAEKRVVVQRNSPLLNTGGKSADESVLLPYLEDVPPQAVLIFYHSGKADSRRSLTKKLVELGANLDCNPLSDADIAEIGRAHV